MTHHGRLGPLFFALALAGCGSLSTYSKVSRDQGVADLAAGKYAEAEGAFSDAVRQNPRDYQSHTYLGILYDRQKQYANALAHFKTSLDVQNLSEAGKKDYPFRIKTLAAQADTLAKVPDRDTAVNALELKAADSRTGEESYQLARLYAARGDADSAIAAFDRAAAQAPGQFFLAKEQGLYLLRQGLKPQAEVALRRAYRLFDSDPEVNAGLRTVGVIPGPSLKDPNQLQKPILPLGPIPNYLDRDRNKPAATPETPVPETPGISPKD